MTQFAGITWPYVVGFRDICYQPVGFGKQEKITVLEVANPSDESTIQVAEKTFGQFSCGSETADPYFSLVVITQSWACSETGHQKAAQYNISQGSLNKILEIKDMKDFFCRTRVDGVGVFTSSVPRWYKKGRTSDIEFALLYSAFLGFWVKYDYKRKRWRGILINSETSLDLVTIGKRVIRMAKNEMFPFHFAAEYAMEFLGLYSGDLDQRIMAIERFSGYHEKILRPIPATYKELEDLSARTAGTGNLISFYNGVAVCLVKELIQCLRNIYQEEDSDNEDATDHVDCLKQRLSSLSLYLNYLERRTERQTAAMFHLVNQVNASTNLAIARDTKTLAVSSKHDASSMKILAAMATVFLPGAFVASLFSTSMFNWFANDGMPVVSRRFWIYWVFTLPLTIITVGLWIGWELWSRRKQRQEREVLQSEGVIKNDF